MSNIIKMEPPTAAADFLRSTQWAIYTIAPVAGDASFRRYFRVTNDHGKCAILMDAPPPHEDPRPFIDMSKFLKNAGFRAPEIFAEDLERGLVLLEDFGDSQMREFLDAEPAQEQRVYRQAIDTLIELTAVEPATVPPYDMATYLREVGLFAEYYMPAMNLDEGMVAFKDIWTNIFTTLADSGVKPVTVLRDYHAENIMLLNDGDQGIIDFQDALIGHPAYDLVSLLQDARRDVSVSLETEMLVYYASKTNVSDNFLRDYALLGAQRNTKIIGIFTRLWKRDGKNRYLDFLPRMWGLLERDLAHPELSDLADWFDRYVPVNVRARSPLDMLTT